MSAAATMGPIGEHAAPRETRRLGAKGQGNAWRTIINQIPPHHTYIEPFAGWATVMMKKRLAQRTILIDKDAGRVTNLLLELRSAFPPLLANIVEPAEVLWSTIGAADDSRRRRSADLPRRPATSANLASSAEAPLGSGNQRQCYLVAGDAFPFLADYQWQGTEFVYCDPPYPLETRTSSHRYLFEMADDPANDLREHSALLALLKRLPCPVMVSSYHSALYAIALKDWRMITFMSMTRGGHPKEEHLWMNYPPPVELHDYRFLGRNFRERQDIKRLKNRWLAKLAKMPPLKRQAMLAAIQESS